MASNLPTPSPESEERWQMPVVPGQYDPHPLTDEERRALEHFAEGQPKPTGSRKTTEARQILARFNQPIEDVFFLRHQGRSPTLVAEIHRVMRREMYQRNKTFWEWSPQEWVEVLCPNKAVYIAERGQGRRQNFRTSLMDMAYLLGGVTDLRLAGIGYAATLAANLYFGVELVAEQCQKVLDTLVGSKQLGYKAGKMARSKIQQYLSTVFLLQRSPCLENITEERLAEATQGSPEDMQWARTKVTRALRRLGFLPTPPELVERPPRLFDSSGMAPSWYAWCHAWYERAVDLTPDNRASYMSRILAVGRWLSEKAPEVCTPEQWTEDLAMRFRVDICSWTNGQYSSDLGQHLLQKAGKLNKPMVPRTIAYHLTVLRRFLSDLVRRPHAVGGAPARRIRLDFSPIEVLQTPRHLRPLMDLTSPRDIDLRAWTRLAIAAATLSASDLPQGTATYPLSLYRAVALIWVTSARRPNEIVRLRLDCVRADVEPELLGESDQVIEYLTILASGMRQGAEVSTNNKAPLLYYLQVPSGKTRGPFYIWIPEYVVQAIEAWKQERPQNQDKQIDRKDREEVDFLFCYRNFPLAQGFINRSVIPALCAKAGVPMEDAKGRITGHRGRSTRLTLLRSRGVSLDDLAEYAGHTNTQTIRRYARQNPLQLHRIIRDADDVSRVIEGVVDLEAAAQGIAALRWFIGYDADGEPMYCANQAYHTCPHRLDCVHCGMFIGGEKARLLHEGEATLPVTSKVPMTPVEKCVVNGDQAGAETCRAALRQVPAPETPDLALIFNPEGLSNAELEKLARLGTHDALDKLRRALSVHQERLAEVQQSKTGRSALVGAQKKRISLLEALIVDCEHRLHKQQNESEDPSAM
jgi:integrase